MQNCYAAYRAFYFPSRLCFCGALPSFRRIWQDRSTYSSLSPILWLNLHRIRPDCLGGGSCMVPPAADLGWTWGAVGSALVRVEPQGNLSICTTTARPLPLHILILNDVLLISHLKFPFVQNQNFGRTVSNSWNKQTHTQCYLPQLPRSLDLAFPSWEPEHRVGDWPLW